MSDNWFRRNRRRPYRAFTEANLQRRESDLESTHSTDGGTDPVFSDSVLKDRMGSPIVARMRSLFEKQLYTDVIFYDESNHDSYIAAHRAVLAAESSLFAKMLFEDKDSKPEMVIEISNIRFEVFKMLVKYFYTDEFPTDNKLLLEVYDAAHRFSVPTLEERCLQSLENFTPITEENVFYLLCLSSEKRLESLKMRCHQFVQDNTSAVLNSPEFEASSIDVISSICGLPSLNLQSEVEVFNAISKWVNSDMATAHRTFSNNLLKKIRFLTLTVHEFADIITKHDNIIGESDALKIMTFLSKKSDAKDYSTLPKWCNKCAISRCQNATDFKMPEEGVSVNEDNALKIPLRPTSEHWQDLNRLTCVLNLQFVGSKRYGITAVRLSFQEPVCEKSVIEDIVLRIFVLPNKFIVQERLSVRKSTYVVVKLSRVIKACSSNSVRIAAEARGIQFYKFLQLSGRPSAQVNQDFTYTAHSVPPEKKLFFISGIEYTIFG